MKIANWLENSRHLPTISYSLGLGLIALTVTAIWLADIAFIKEQQRIGVEVNLAGRQRMLSQRIGMIAQNMARFERVNGANPSFTLLGCADQMMRAHVALKSANVELIRSALSEGFSCHVGKPADVPTGKLLPALQAAFFGGKHPLDQMLDEFVETTRRLAQSDPPDEKDIDQIVVLANLHMPVKLNALTNTFQHEGEEALRRLDTITTTMWALTLILIAVEIVLIFRPMARLIQRNMSRIKETLAIAKQRETDLHLANEQLWEGITYARKIQKGLLADVQDMRHSVADVAMLWEPLQVVSGDFVWSSEQYNKVVFFVADCTGHGVPGALLTMIVSSELTKIMDYVDLDDPENLMLYLDKAVRARLGQETQEDDKFAMRESDDGFEAALVIFDRDDNTLTYVGAGIPLFIQSFDGIRRIAADRRHLAYRSLKRPTSFTVHKIDIEPNETFYVATDGATDHIGGKNKRAFGRKRLFEVLESKAYADLETQLDNLKAVLSEYRGEEPARDDYTVLAVTPISAMQLAEKAAE
ncbi:PP2C family protein-serine/threonine phosphatase [Roseibium sp.]|uniref:PP2C family protein-serine/threonine phosphatase n=1 Tax=Roseibium sp. TaxID=1936156 RepID=UPI003B51E024